MADYNLTVPEKAKDFQYGSDTYKAGSQYETNDPCDAIAFYNAAKSTNPEVGRADKTKGFWSNVDKACNAQTAAAPSPAPASPPDETDPAPKGGDAAAQQGAPPAPVAGTIAGTNAAADTGGSSEQNPPPTGEPTRPPDGEANQTHGGEQPQVKTNAGDPVDIFTGAFYLQETDLEIPHTLLPLAFTRTYHSGTAAYGPLGWNWDHTYNLYVRELNDGNIALWRNLHEAVFKFDGVNFEPPNGIFERIKPVTGLSQAYEITGEGGTVTHFERPGGWLDAERIPVKSIQDRHGNMLTFTYGAEDKLEEVRDEDDRFLHFAYDACGLLVEVSDNAGREYRYEHDEQSMQLTHVTSPPTTDHPEGITKIYHYEQPYALPELRHNIVSVEDSKGNVYLENKYEQDPASWSYARVTEQLYGGYLYQFRYTQLQWAPENALYINIPAVRVEVLNPDFGLETYTFNYRGDLLDRRFRLNKDNSFRIVAIQYAFDSQGNLAVTTKPDGSQEINTYDSGNADPCMRGKLLQKEFTSASGFPSPSRIIWKGKYEPLYQLLTEEKNETNALIKYKYDFDVTPVAPDNSGKLIEIIAPDATLPDGTLQISSIKYEHHNNGQVKAIVQPDGARQEMAYGSAGNTKNRLIKTTFDAGGLNISHETGYNAFGFDAETTDGNGNTTQTIVNALGLPEKTLLPAILGSRAEWVLHYDTDRKVIAQERPKGAYTDPLLASGNIRDTIDRDVLGYPTGCRLSSNTGEQRVIRVRCDFRGLPEETINPDGSRMVRTYDERGLLIREKTTGTDGAVLFAKRVYDRSGKLIQETNTYGSTTKYEYDGFGRISKVTLPNQTERKYTWIKGDLLASEEATGEDGFGTNSLLSKKSYTYDEKYRKVTETVQAFAEDPAAAVGITTTFFYDKLDRIEKNVDNRGGRKAWKYDGLGRLITETDPMSNEVHYTYDNNGNRIRTESHHQEPDGTMSIITKRYTYDARNRQTEIVEPDGAKLITEYDDRDLIVRQTDYLGLVKETKYDSFGNRLKEVYDAGGLAITHQWTLDQMSRPTAYIDPTGQVSGYFYDSVGRNNKTTYPNGFSSLKTFNDKGQIITEQLGSGVAFDYTYDAANRLTNINNTVVPASVVPLQEHQFTYDGLDRVVRAKTGASEIIRKYDSRSRLTAEATLGHTIRCRYNDSAGIVEKILPDGRTENYTYNLNGVLIKIEETVHGALGSGGNVIAAFVPSGTALLGETVYQGGLIIRNEYDERRRLTERTMSSPAGLDENVKYRYDKANRRKVEAIVGQNPANKYFEFDPKYRLSGTKDGFSAIVPNAVTQAEHNVAVNAVKAASSEATHAASYLYDLADARLKYAETSSTAKNYAYLAGHRIQNDGVHTYTYSGDGTVQSDGTFTYSTDAFGRIVAIKSGAGVVCSIAYDAFNRPSIISESGKPARSFNYLGAFVEQENENGAAARQITLHPATSIPIAWHTNAGTHYTLFDGRYNLIGLADTSGVLLETYRYDAFGKPSVHNAAGTAIPASGFGVEPVFGGQRYLSTTGLYLSKRRLFDPVNGVFLSPDPKGYTDSASLYVYAAQNPVDYIDPNGEFAFLAILAVMAVGAVIAGGLNLARQEIQIAEGTRESFSWGELGLSAGIGAVVAPLLVLAPELTVPLAAYGAVGGLDEMSHGNYATGTFDIVTSLAPFGLKGVRNATFGNVRAPLNTRAGRFNLIQENLLTPTESNPSRVTHLTTEENINAIQNGDASQGIPPGRLLTKNAPFIEGGKEGAWVAPSTAKQMGAWRRLMTGLPNSENYVEFDVVPGELANPGGIKRPFSPYQRQIPSAIGPNNLPEGYIDLSGRNPMYGVLPNAPTWPLLLAPPYRSPKSAHASSLPDKSSKK